MAVVSVPEIDVAAMVGDRIDQLLAEVVPQSVSAEEFLGRQFDLGLAWVHFPEERGGLGVSARHQRLINDRLASAGAPDPFPRNGIGCGLAAPTILSHGSAAHGERYLRPIFTGEEIWCQLFSEPGAGSDVASLATRAVRDGDEWVVNGQKVWTTFAHVARWGMLFARTHPEQPKHKGLTYFVLDMQASGVEVRPLVQMTGDAEFNEVYLTDVRVPDSARLGDIGDGWRVALTTLMNERVAIGAQIPARGGGPIAEPVRAYRARPERSEAERDELMRLWVRAEALRLTNIRVQQLRAAGTPGPEGSIGKLMVTELNQQIAALAVRFLGAEGMLKPGGYPMARPTQITTDVDIQQLFLRSRANSIEGGTSEIMRNILGEQVLGLPPDVRLDKDLPWNQVPRS